MSVAIDGAIDSFPPCPHSISQPFQDFHCGVPVDACVCDTYSLLQCLRAFGRDFLTALVEVGFDHDAYDACLASPYLIGDGLCYFGLVSMVFLGVALMDRQLRRWKTIRRYSPCEQSIIITSLIPFFLHASLAPFTLSASKFVFPPPPLRITNP